MTLADEYWERQERGLPLTCDCPIPDPQPVPWFGGHECGKCHRIVWVVGP